MRAGLGAPQTICLVHWYLLSHVTASPKMAEFMHARPQHPTYVQAVLLIGFSQYEVDAFRAFMIDMDADMVKVNIMPYLLHASHMHSLLQSSGLDQVPYVVA